MSEICPRKVRGALVSCYQFCTCNLSQSSLSDIFVVLGITIGLLLGAVVNNSTQNRNDTGAYRIPIGIQFAWAVVLATGLFFLPDSPRFYVKKGRIEDARRTLARLRGQPAESDYVESELAEIVANAEYERQIIPSSGYFDGWLNCFTGSLWNGGSNVRRTILGTSLQMMQQWTGMCNLPWKLRLTYCNRC